MKIKDLTNKRFGNLRVIRLSCTKRGRGAIWLCVCDCGNERLVDSQSLSNGLTTCCKPCTNRKTSERTKSKLLGKRFGRLVVVEEMKERSKFRSVVWKCICDCGEIVHVPTSRLTGGKTKSCGCLKRDLSKVRLPIDITGQRFGKLVTIKRVDVPDKGIMWECICDCGGLKFAYCGELRCGDTKSCGCLNNTKPEGEASRLVYFHRYKRNALKRGFSFEITFNQYIDIISCNCSYCGRRPGYHRHTNCNGGFIGNGLDRIDNSRGYTIENIAACCTTCNRAKKDMSAEEFFVWLKRLYYMQIKKTGGIIS